MTCRRPGKHTQLPTGCQPHLPPAPQGQPRAWPGQGSVCLGDPLPPPLAVPPGLSKVTCSHLSKVPVTLPVGAGESLKKKPFPISLSCHHPLSPQLTEPVILKGTRGHGVPHAIQAASVMRSQFRTHGRTATVTLKCEQDDVLWLRK